MKRKQHCRILSLLCACCLLLLPACEPSGESADPAGPSPGDGGPETSGGFDMGGEETPNPHPPETYDLAMLLYTDALLDAPPGAAMGTGGSAWRLPAAARYEHEDLAPEQIDSWEGDPDLRFFGSFVTFGKKFSAAGVTKMQEHLQKNRVLLAYDRACFSELGNSTGSSIQEDHSFWGGLVIIRQVAEMSGVTKEFWSTFDPSDGRKLALSDLFYDSVDYLDYINTAILNGKAPPLGGREAFLSLTDSQWQIHPFFGIPADYDRFYLNENGDLCIALPMINPYFFLNVTFVVPLDNTVSPYGSDWFNLLPACGGVTMDGRLPLLIPEFRCGDPERAGRVNQAVRSFAEASLAALTAQPVFRDALRQLPATAGSGMLNVSMLGPFVSVSLRRNFGVPPGDGSSFAVRTFRADTMTQIDPLTLLPPDFRWETAQYGDCLFTADVPGYDVAGRLPSDFRPPANPALRNAHIDNGNLVVEMRVTETKYVSVVVLGRNLLLPDETQSAQTPGP